MPRTASLALPERKDNVVARMLGKADHLNMATFVRVVCCDKVSLLATE